jgi:hypothetical protein
VELFCFWVYCLLRVPFAVTSHVSILVSGGSLMLTLGVQYWAAAILADVVSLDQMARWLSNTYTIH